MTGKKRLIEQGFPIAKVSKIATRESWRKEINRPTSYIHKWWARRLGSVFRSLLLASEEYDESTFFDKYYNGGDLSNRVVLDPFMGSGTTITEAVKLRAKVVGVDINPVAVGLVQTALEKYDIQEVKATFENLKRSCANKIRRFYKAKYKGMNVAVLYYFWVKTIKCDDCGKEIPLFKSTVFSKNAYATKKPQAYSVCPNCGHINSILYNASKCTCEHCKQSYDPQKGNTSGVWYICPHCGKHEKIVDYVRRKKSPLESRMYAKMVYDQEGKKHYLGIDAYDLKLYEEASKMLVDYKNFIPDDDIKDGINTNQILNYQYTKWNQMFNNRQLLSFCILEQEILKIKNLELRRLFSYLMSGTLEFNNMFCSFKGEGTGAVRPLFYNHILKNEMMPLEANVWGEKVSSGSFSTFFKSRILRMMDYKEHPFELKITDKGVTEKVFPQNCRIEVHPTNSLTKWSLNTPLILCQDSTHLPLPDNCVDLIVTDPPFFDNVNYSELADFFYVWLRKMNIGIGSKEQPSTRSNGEVQDNKSDLFSKKLCSVFKEGHRLLKKDGSLIFTYHHSRTDGWVSVYNAICGAGYVIQQVFPIKAEMAVSVAIMSAKTPINYDLVFVCKKNDDHSVVKPELDPIDEYKSLVEKFNSEHLNFSDGDKKILMYGIALKLLSNKGETIITEEKLAKTMAKWN